MSHIILPFFGVLSVEGADAADFLHRQLSNDIINLKENEACYATYNTAQGRVIANMIVLRHQHHLDLIMAKDLIEKVQNRLKMFIMRSKVCLQNNSETHLIRGTLPSTPAPFRLPETPPLRLNTQGETSRTIKLPHGGQLSLIPHDKLPETQTDSTLWHLYEIEHGYPWISLASSESAVAQMLNQHLLGGVHFKKGCYPGQEIIARAQYRGKVKRGLAVIQSNDITQISEKINDENGQEIAEVINSVPHHSGSLNLCVCKLSITTATSLQSLSGSPCTLKINYLPQEEE